MSNDFNYYFWVQLEAKYNEYFNVIYVKTDYKLPNLSKNFFSYFSFVKLFYWKVYTCKVLTLWLISDEGLRIDKNKIPVFLLTSHFPYEYL